MGEEEEGSFRADLIPHKTRPILMAQMSARSRRIRFVIHKNTGFIYSPPSAVNNDPLIITSSPPPPKISPAMPAADCIIAPRERL